jgi:hypothetical protein
VTRITSTCDFCLRDDQPCTVYDEGVYCDSCQMMARKEERADVVRVAIWTAILTLGAALWVAVIYFFVVPLLS